MATQLSLYNEALRLIGDRKLSSLSEDRKARRILDDVWDDDTIRYCLEQGYWDFAMRAVKVDYDPSIDPAFGYQYAFEQPSDMVRVAAVCTDEYFNQPMLDYITESGYWYTDYTEIYMKYVSDDASWGGDLSTWPETFAKYVACHLAVEVCESITQNDSKLKYLEKKLKKRLVDARSKDAMRQPTRFPPPGSWVRSRGGGRGSRFDRGNRGSLTD